jgi:hypothetical protein
MTCPLCRSRQGKRQCPALGQSICPVCCGTKRLVEIRCPDSCGYLASAKRHPPAQLLRERDRDVSLLWPVLATLTERQSRFFFLFQSLAARLPQDPLRPLRDDDVATAALSMATSLEAAARGVIYEQVPDALPARQLVAAMRSAFDELVGELQGPRTPLEIDAAKALRSVEEAARRIGGIVGDPTGGYLALLDRVLEPPASGTAEPGRVEGGRAGGLILP